MFFDNFYETDRRLYWENHWGFRLHSPRWKLWVFRAKRGGGIIVHIDEKHKVSVITLDFDECVTKFVCLWPYNSVQKNKFLDLERAPLSSPNMSTATNCGYSSDCNIIF